MLPLILLAGLWLAMIIYAKPVYENAPPDVLGKGLIVRTPTSVTTSQAVMTSGQAPAETAGQQIFIDTTTCNEGQQDTIVKAWADAAILAKAASYYL